MRLSILILLIASLLSSCKKSRQQTSSPEVLEETEFINEQLQTINLPVEGESHLPRLTAIGDQLYMSWVEQKGDLAVLKHSNYYKEKWDEPRVTAWGNDWFVNWADFPALGVNEEEYVLTNTLQKSAEGTYDYDVRLQLSRGNKLIKDNFLLNTDGIPAEHGFVSIQPYKKGFSVSWLDGRNTKNENPEENRMTLRNAFVDFNGNITRETEIDSRVCDCCNTAMAITQNGPIVVYRDRSEETLEIRDMAIVRQGDGEWTKPMTIGNDNWQLNGCPVNGPAIDANENKVIVSWFTAQGDTPRVMTVFSIDNGATFGTPIRIDGGNAIGRVDTQLLIDGSALVSWLEPKGDNVVLQVARVYADGNQDAPITITNTSAERQSGFPQLAVLGKMVYVAWTDVEGDKSTVKMSMFKM